MRSIDIASYDIDKIIFEAKNALAYNLSEKINTDDDIIKAVESINTNLDDFFRGEIRQKLKAELKVKFQNRINKLITEGNHFDSIRLTVPLSVISDDELLRLEEIESYEQKVAESNSSCLWIGVSLLFFISYGFFQLFYSSSKRVGSGISNEVISAWGGFFIVLFCLIALIVIAGASGVSRATNKYKHKKKIKKNK